MAMINAQINPELKPLHGARPEWGAPSALSLSFSSLFTLWVCTASKAQTVDCAAVPKQTTGALSWSWGLGCAIAIVVSTTSPAHVFPISKRVIVAQTCCYQPLKHIVPAKDSGKESELKV
jgi:hypothetical protein